MGEMLKELVRLTCKKLEDAKQIWKSTQSMQTDVEQEEIQSLVQAIDLRQKWMQESEDCQEKIEDKLETLYKKYSIKSLGEINQTFYPEIEKINENQKKIEKIYRQCYELEKQNQGKIKHLLEDYKEEIMRLQQGKQAHQVYGKQDRGQSLLINKKS